MNMPQPIEYEAAILNSQTQSDLPETENERLLSILSEVRGTEILHVGCVNHRLPQSTAEARHYLHYQLCRRFAHCHIVGLDIEADGIEQLGKLGFDVVWGDAHDMPYREAFDTVVAGELLEHVQNPGLFLSSCVRALKPGGRLVLSTPNVFTPILFLAYLKNYDRAFNSDHVMWFCPQTLREILRRAELTVTSLHFVDDLQPDIVDSVYYKSFAFVWRTVRFLFPRRLRNTMVVVCERK
jgi:2-polyprenyl-3-methyl-5-hydroxy-6-metoxy-1,4-benzoquinol methylase